MALLRDGYAQAMNDDAREPMSIDADTSAWLSEQADLYFSGDKARALNHHLRQAMNRLKYLREQAEQGKPVPQDLWGSLEARLPPGHSPTTR